MNWKIKAVAGVASFALFGFVAPAKADESNCTSTLSISIEDVEGQKAICEGIQGQVLVGLPGVPIDIPIPARDVTASYAFTADSQVAELSVSVDSEGWVTLVLDGLEVGKKILDTVVADAATMSATATVYPGCGTASAVLYPYKWNTTWSWSYNAAGQPNTSALTAIQEAANLWTVGANRCTGAIYQSSFANNYVGGTSKSPSPFGSGGCAVPDGFSVVGWGPLSSGILALTCTYKPSNVAIESDIKFSTAVQYYTGSSASGCFAKYDLREIAAHEVGHVVGLDHSVQADSQLMKPQFLACETDQRLLAPGDIVGLKTKY